MTTTDLYTAQNLDRSQRASRIISAFALLGVTVVATAGSLGWMSVLPLLAIYPLVTGVIGWDPVYELFGIGDSENGKLSAVSRAELAVTGTTLIGCVFVVPEYTPICTLLALSGVFPAISALIGEDILQAVVAYRLPMIPQVAQSTAAERSRSAAMTAIEEVRQGKASRKAA